MRLLLHLGASKNLTEMTIIIRHAAKNYLFSERLVARAARRVV